MNCIVVDDEPLALGLLTGFIKKVPYLKSMGTFENAGDALLLLNDDEVDLIYLDINMPDFNGLQLAQAVDESVKIIFTTAYDTFAIKGFELNAVDYLLKPFTFERFLVATERAHDKLNRRNVLPSKDDHVDHIFIKTEHSIIKVQHDDINFVEGYKDYLKIHTNSSSRPLLTLKSMKSMEKVLEKKGFVRIHRSYIISVDKIHSIRSGKVKINGKWLPISDNYKEKFYSSVIEGNI
jgi:DNA-binding LytR/AlgR family response regulator